MEGIIDWKCFPLWLRFCIAIMERHFQMPLKAARRLSRCSIVCFVHNGASRQGFILRAVQFLKFTFTIFLWKDGHKYTSGKFLRRYDTKKEGNIQNAQLAATKNIWSQPLQWGSKQEASFLKPRGCTVTSAPLLPAFRLVWGSDRLWHYNIIQLLITNFFHLDIIYLPKMKPKSKKHVGTTKYPPCFISLGMQLGWGLDFD